MQTSYNPLEHPEELFKPSKETLKPRQEPRSTKKKKKKSDVSRHVGLQSQHMAEIQTETLSHVTEGAREKKKEEEGQEVCVRDSV